jgi:serine protein kinase
MSPWAIKRMEGKKATCQVSHRTHPAVGAAQVAITKTEPATKQPDISAPVGKVDIQARKPGAKRPRRLQLPGGLCLANQGLLEFVEMFKAPIKMLHPLTATQEGNFKGTEGFSAIPFTGSSSRTRTRSDGTFRNNKNNEVPRPDLHRQGSVLPAAVRGSEDLRQAARQLVLSGTPCAPGTPK